MTPQGSPGAQKGSNVDNSSRKWNKKLKIGINTNFGTRNSMVESSFENFQNFTPPVMSQGSTGAQNVSNLHNTSKKMNKKFKIDI